MVTKSGIVALGLLAAIVNRSLALSCWPCNEYVSDNGTIVPDDRCRPPPTNCSYGITKSACDCCDECAKGPGEKCEWFYGSPRCAPSLECKKNQNYYGAGGVCVDNTQRYIPTTISPLVNEFTIENQTFAVLEDHQGLTWDQAKTACIDAGYDLAEPDNLISVANYLKQYYGYTYYWLGGHSTGSPDFKLKWLSGPVISRSSLWRPKYQTPNDYCVYLRADNGGSNPIGSYPCSDTNYLFPLCEARGPPPTTAAPEVFTCDELGGVLIGSQCLEFNMERRSWTSAVSDCASKKGSLASLEDPKAVLDYVKFLSAYGFWVGASDIASEGNWEWLNGTAMNAVQLPWASNVEPNNVGTGSGEDCLVLNGHGYYDNHCSRGDFFICEMEVNTCDESNRVLVGNQCLQFNMEIMNWNDAKSSCATKGGQLAVLEDPQAVLNYVQANNWQGFVGASDSVSEGVWVWENGKSVEVPWVDGEPNSADSGEDCLLVYSRGYNDVSCSSKNHYTCDLHISLPHPFSNEFTIGNQIFAVLEDHQGVSWDQAKTACIDAGYDLAEPDNLVSLARHLNQYYDYTYYWLGGFGTGPDLNVNYRTSIDYCFFLNDDSNYNPLGSYPCSDTNYLYPLCELRRPAA